MRRCERESGTCAFGGATPSMTPLLHCRPDGALGISGERGFTHSRTHSHTHALNHARTHSRTHSHTHALTHSRTHALTHRLGRSASRESREYGLKLACASSDENVSVLTHHGNGQWSATMIKAHKTGVNAVRARARSSHRHAFARARRRRGTWRVV